MSIISVEEAIDSVIQTIKLTIPKECPRCRLFVQGDVNIERFFGWRNCNGSIIPQSYCRKCRSKKFNPHKRYLFDYEQLTIHTIKQAKNMKKNINIEGLVSNKGYVKNINLEDGATIKLCSASLTDQFNDNLEIFLWGNDVNRIKNYSKVMIIDGFVHNYKGKIALSVSKLGRIEIISEYKKKHFPHNIHVNEPSQLSNDSWIVGEDDASKSYFKPNLNSTKSEDFKF